MFKSLINKGLKVQFFFNKFAFLSLIPLKNVSTFVLGEKDKPRFIVEFPALKISRKVFAKEKLPGLLIPEARRYNSIEGNSFVFTKRPKNFINDDVQFFCFTEPLPDDVLVICDFLPLHWCRPHISSGLGAILRWRSRRYWRGPGGHVSLGVLDGGE